MARNTKPGRRAILCWCCAGVATLVAGTAAAQAPAPTSGVTRSILHKADGPGGQLVSIQAMADVAAGVVVARHTHPGVETGYLLSGGGILSVQGQPDREVKAGDSYLVPAEVPHEFKNGAAPAKLLVTYVVDKDKPLASPAPA